MEIEIRVISKESIKPSAPTPDKLRHYQLSYLDQVSPSFFIRSVLFYPQEADNNDLITREERCNRIKKSLSEALTLYYPLGGRVINKLYVDCNDEGVYFVEAEAKCQLSSILHNPNPQDMNKFLPSEFYDQNVSALPLIVQLTFFDCGGMTIGVGLNHVLGDGLSYSMFLNSWSAISRGDTGFQTPIFGAEKLFPSVDMSSIPTSDVRMAKDKVVAKRFVFGATEIAALINRYSNNTGGGGGVKRSPTRVEAVSGFIWNRFIVATQPKETSNEDKIFKLLTPVNIRMRMEPKVADNYFGNIKIPISVPSMEINKDGHYTTVNPIRDAITKQINTEILKKLQQADKHLNFLTQHFRQLISGDVIFTITSICRFPVYEVDFGWGKPVFRAKPPSLFKNLVYLFDTKSGEGMEAWINLKEEDMAKFETDEEVLALFHRSTNGN